MAGSADVCLRSSLIIPVHFDRRKMPSSRIDMEFGALDYCTIAIALLDRVVTTWSRDGTWATANEDDVTAKYLLYCGCFQKYFSASSSSLSSRFGRIFRSAVRYLPLLFICNNGHVTCCLSVGCTTSRFNGSPQIHAHATFCSEQVPLAADVHAYSFVV